MRARRVVFRSRGETRVEPFEIGSPEPDQVLVEMLYTAISPGTERAFLFAEPGTTTARKGFPFQPGYSGVARVIAVGSSVTRFAIGQTVASLFPHVSHVLMPDTIGPGFAPEKYRYAFVSPIAGDGAFVPLHYLWPLDDGLDTARLKASAAFNIAGVGVTGARYARVELGESVVVLGLGPVGLLAAWAAKASGGYPVTGVDPLEPRRRMASRLGVDHALASVDEDPRLYRIVIEATGRPEAFALALKRCKPGGRVVLLGSTRGLVESIDVYNDVHRKGVEIIGAQVLTRPMMDSAPGRWTAWDENSLVLRLIADGRLDLAPLVETEIPAARAADAYDLLTRAPDALGALLDWTRD